ncbi:hypothetical protein LTR94_021933, partial [Friedmanniomyces endolithicus]
PHPLFPRGRTSGALPEVHVLGVGAAAGQVQGEALGPGLLGVDRRLGRRRGRRFGDRTGGGLGRRLEGRGAGGSSGRSPSAAAAGRVGAEEGDGGLKLFGLGRQFFRGRRHLFRGARILLRHLVELLNGLVDLVGADVLFAAGGGDFRDQFGGLADVRHQALQHVAGLLSGLDRVARDRADLGGGRLAAFGQFAHFRSHDREALAVFPGAGGLDRRVQGQQIGLTRDLLHDADLVGDGAHGVHRAGHGLAAQFGVLGRLARDLFGLGGVVGVLFDVGSHLLHRGRGLFGGGGLFGRALAHLLGGGRQFLAARGDVVGGRQGVGDHAAQAFHHRLQRQAQGVLVRQGLGLDRQVALGDLVGHGGGGAQIGRHAIDRIDQILDLVIGRDLDVLIQVADGDRLNGRGDLAQAQGDGARNPQGGDHADDQSGDHQGDEHRPGFGEDLVAFDAGGLAAVDVQVHELQQVGRHVVIQRLAGKHGLGGGLVLIDAREGQHPLAVPQIVFELAGELIVERPLVVRGDEGLILRPFALDRVERGGDVLFDLGHARRIGRGDVGVLLGPQVRSRRIDAVDGVDARHPVFGDDGRLVVDRAHLHDADDAENEGDRQDGGEGAGQFCFDR